jgi:predicted ABC-type sugar transport system permease subunit
MRTSSLPAEWSVLGIIAALIVIALAASVTALLLQALFGRPPVLVLMGQLLAAFGAAGFALSIRRQR